MKRLLFVLMLLCVPAYASLPQNVNDYVTSTGSNIQVLMDPGSRVDGQPVYRGVAAGGALQSDSVWLVQYFTYDSNNNLISRTSATGSWANRAILVYS